MIKRIYINPVYLKSDDISSLNYKLIGFGNDANVYDTKDGFLFKIYHSEILPNYMDNRNAFYDSDGVRIDKPKISIDYRKNYLDYVDKFDTRLFSTGAINSAIKKQEFVDLTYLPLAPIIIDNHFGGCVLKYHKNYTDIHNFRYFPLSVKTRMLEEVLVRTKELLDNYIYHLDLNNKKDGLVGHSNILASLRKSVQIIDIDGRSAIYRESKSVVHEVISLNSCASLIYELLFDLIIDDHLLESDKDYLVSVFEKKHIPSEFIDSFIYEKNSVDTLNEVLKFARKKRGIFL